MATLGGTAPFWEKDGTLRAYANRMFILVVIESLAIVALAAVIFFSRQIPPTIIHIGPTGEPTVISPVGAQGRITAASLRGAKIASAPTDMEKQNAVITFAKNYWEYDEHTLTHNWAAALNTMTSNLYQKVFQKIQKENQIGQMERDHESSVVTITSIQEDQSAPMVYHVYATRTTSSIVNNSETNLRSAESYTIRLVETDRTVSNPGGLLIADFNRTVSSSETGLQANQ